MNRSLYITGIAVGLAATFLIAPHHSHGQEERIASEASGGEQVLKEIGEPGQANAGLAGINERLKTVRSGFKHSWREFILDQGDVSPPEHDKLRAEYIRANFEAYTRIRELELERAAALAESAKKKKAPFTEEQKWTLESLRTLARSAESTQERLRASANYQAARDLLKLEAEIAERTATEEE